ncbi:hypothetical protein QWZ10_25320 [Paracoccus cavernae]|uniref:Uncharacterized protein n=1 Tax=Paracoccus cavernae TaxID=1571207 RepID=A0ABT8DC94_9RHOB|nr:hypothetical protein [Paracoccus cavernae]
MADAACRSEVPALTLYRGRLTACLKLQAAAAPELT